VKKLALVAFLIVSITSGGAARAGEPVRCGTVVYEWVGSTAAVVDYWEDPGLSITIVGYYVWAQNTAEEASSKQHLVSVELTRESPNPYTICVGDTTDPEPVVRQVEVISLSAVPVAVDVLSPAPRPLWGPVAV